MVEVMATKSRTCFDDDLGKGLVAVILRKFLSLNIVMVMGEMRSIVVYHRIRRCLYHRNNKWSDNELPCDESAGERVFSVALR